MKFFFKGCSALVVVVALVALTFLLSINYNDFVLFSADILNIPETRIYNLKKYLTPSTFKLLPLIPIVLLIFGIVCFMFQKVIFKYVGVVYNYFSNFFSFYKHLTRQEKIIVYVIIFISFIFNLYNVIYEPILVDEASTFNRFTKGGILTSITYYPEPNNHVLHSLLTSITYHLPFSNQVTMRLPNLLVALLTAFVMFYAFSKHLNKKVALIILPFGLFMFSMAYYAHQSRGYALVIFAFLVCFHSTLSIIGNPKNINLNKHLFFITLGGVIGFYAMPSFLYPYFSCVSFLGVYFLFSKNFKGIKKLFIYGMLCVLVVTLLYTPIFILSGLEVIIANKHVAPIPRLDVVNGLYEHFDATSKFLTYLPLLYILVFILLAALVIIKNRDVKGYFGLYTLCIAPLLLILHSVIPFARTWSHLAIPLVFLLGFCIYKCNDLKHFKLKYIILPNVLTITGLILLFHWYIVKFNFAPYVYHNVGNYLFNNGAKNVISNHLMLKKDVKFMYENRGETIQFTDVTEPITEDLLKSLKGNYDVLITTQKPNFDIGSSELQYWGIYYQGKAIYSITLK